MNVSTEIKNAYKNGSHAKILGVSFPDVGYTVPQDEVYYESMTLDEAIFDSDSFEAVGCIASQFVISIRDSGINLKDRRITVTISLADVDNSTIPLFSGYIDSVDREAQKKMQKITAYDALYSKGNTDIASWYNNLSFPITIKNFRDSLFSYLGITQVTTVLPNDSLSIAKEYSPTTLKAIGVIKSICQINGCFGIINREGNFEYRFLNTSSTAESVSFYKKMDYKDYVVNPVDKLTIRQNTEDTGITIGTGDNQYIIQGNMFTYNLDSNAVRTIASNIYTYLKDIEYIPFNAANNGYPWIEVGDNCVLNYSVYDFDNSTSAQSVYKSVTVVVFKRTMKGIQNLVDEYSAEGKELQREFLSDASVDLDILQQTVENLIRQQSTEVTTYRNPSKLTIGDGETATIADLVYEASQGNTIIFHEEADLEVEANEALTNGTYIEGDVVANVRYYVNGNRLPNNLSEEILTEGKHLLSLTQFWQAGLQETSRVQAKLTVEGGNVTLQRFRAQAYITVKQSDYHDAAIEVTRMPDKEVYALGDTLDYTGVVISKVYYDDYKPSENVTIACVFSPAEGETVSSTDMIDVLVTYTEINEVGEEITYETSFTLSTQYLTGLTVEQEPNIVDYHTCDTLDLSGVKIMADYIDGTSNDVTASCEFSPDSGYVLDTDEGFKEIIVTYTENGITVQTSFFVNVSTDFSDVTVYVTNPDSTLEPLDNYMNMLSTLNSDSAFIKLKSHMLLDYTHTDDRVIKSNARLSNGGIVPDGHYGPCTSHFYMDVTSILLCNLNPNEFDARWGRLNRYGSNVGEQFDGYYFTGEQHINGWQPKLLCPDFAAPNNQSIRLSGISPYHWKCKYNMSNVPVCGPITVGIPRDSRGLFSEYFDNPNLSGNMDNVFIYTPGYDYYNNTWSTYTVEPVVSSILGPSEFKGKVIGQDNNDGIEVYYNGTRGSGVFTERCILSGYDVAASTRFNLHLCGDETERRYMDGFEMSAAYSYPVDIKILNTGVYVNSERWYRGEQFVVTMPFTEILYIGNKYNAPNWALEINNDELD